MKHYKYIFKICLSLLLLVYFIHKTDIGKVFHSIKDIPIYIFLIINILQLLSVGINSIKWNVFLPDKPLLKLFKFNLIAQYYSLILPGQFTGSMIKIYIAGKDQNSIEKATTSVITDKATGLIALLCISFYGLLFTITKLPITLKYSIILLIIIGLLLIFIFQFTPTSKLILYLSKTFSQKYKFMRKIDMLLKIWKTYTIKQLILSLTISFIYQMLYILIITILAKYLYINLMLNDWCWILGILSVALFLPISIAGIGIRELTLVGLLGFMGISNEKAMALSFSILAISCFLAVIGGILELFRNSSFTSIEVNQHKDVDKKSD